jgi:hypothetical protein
MFYVAPCVRFLNFTRLAMAAFGRDDWQVGGRFQPIMVDGSRPTKRRSLNGDTWLKLATFRSIVLLKSALREKAIELARFVVQTRQRRFDLGGVFGDGLSANAEHIGETFLARS